MKSVVTILVAVLLFGIIFVAIFGETAKIVTGAFALYLLPFFLAEEVYDVAEKLNPQISTKGHVIVAAFIGVGFFLLWPLAVSHAVQINFFFIRDALLYTRPIDSALGWLDYPIYAWRYGVIAFVSGMAGYIFEMGILWFVRRFRHGGQGESS